jgi:ATP-dependent DNA helicase RecG
MTPERLGEIIVAGESLDVEFKGEEARPLSDGELVEAIVCMANRSGDQPGWLLVGVEKDGRITGARSRHEAGITDPLRVQALVSGRTRPSLSVGASLVQVDGRPVLVVEVPPVRQPVGTADGKYVRRALGGDGKPACLPFHFHEMQSLQSSRGLLDYSAATVPEATWADLDPLELERFRRSIRESGGRGDTALLKLSDQEMARALGAVSQQGESVSIRVLGLLLFGREEALARNLPTHEVAFQQLRGQKIEVNDFVRWPLIRVTDEFLGRFSARYEEEELMVGMVRVGIPNYPVAAFREALANALIHRDYTRLGAIHVQWHSDRIEIGSPGGFPEGVRLENLLVTQPVPRNPLLADAFKRAGLVERTARGIDSMFFECLRFGKRPPSYGLSTGVSVVVSLSGAKSDFAFARFVAEQIRDGEDLTLEDLLLLRALADEGSVNPLQGAAILQRVPVEAEEALSRLEGKKWLQRGPGDAWRLSSALGARLGLAPDRRSVRVPLGSFEEKIMGWVKAHGRITRGEAVALCGLGSDQAKRILSGMVKQGLLSPRGRGRGAHYGPARRKTSDSPIQSDSPNVSLTARKRGRASTRRANRRGSQTS